MMDRNRRCLGARTRATSARRPCRKQDQCHFTLRKAIRQSVSLAGNRQEQGRNFGYSEVSRVYSMVENTSRAILWPRTLSRKGTKKTNRYETRRQGELHFSTLLVSSPPRLHVKMRLLHRQQRNNCDHHMSLADPRNIRAGRQLASIPQTLPVGHIGPVQA
jgi:hypothetical protein